MATRLYEINPGDDYTAVTETIGSATAGKAVELTVDLAVVNSKEEVVIALKKLQQWVELGLWPPA
jgi:hypothetical protein